MVTINISTAITMAISPNEMVFSTISVFPELKVIPVRLVGVGVVVGVGDGSWQNAGLAVARMNTKTMTRITKRFM